MGIELIALIAAVAVVATGILYLRVPAFVAMFSLLIGHLLSTQILDESYMFAADLLKINRVEYVQLALLLLPFILTVFFLKGRMSKKKLPYEVLPAIFVAGLLILFVYPLVPSAKTFIDIATNDQISRSKDVVYIVAAVMGLVSSWLSFPKPHAEKHHK